MDKHDVVATYVTKVTQLARISASREHAYRPAQIELFNNLADVVTVNDAARVEGNMPDFLFLDLKNPDIPLAYGEAKDLGTDLDRIEQSDQLLRYGAYENLLLTDGLQFRFYRQGERYRTVHIAKQGADGAVHPLVDAYPTLVDEFQALVSKSPAPITSASRLSEIMAGKARRIRDMVKILLATSADSDKGVQSVRDVYGLVKKMLIHDLSIDDFADMYAQTIVYGLFSARFHDESPKSFSRWEAIELVSTTTPFLRDFFDHIAGARFDKRLAYPVDELCEVFRISNVKDIVHRHLGAGKNSDFDKDPIVHFYEDFLALYDKEQKSARGVFYTPTPLVRFVVRNVDRILKEEFGLSKGMADSSSKDIILPAQPGKIKDKAGRKSIKTATQTLTVPRVQILDPAVGTATFLNEAIMQIASSFEGQEGRWPGYVTENLIPRIHGFELMMAPYTIAHMKLGMTLVDSGATFKDRLGVYLTNSLDRPVQLDHDLFSIGLAEAFSHEANAASAIKTDRPIMVVIGNPPWSGESANKSPHARALVDRYKFEPGGFTKLNERNSKWLSDDYVKFMAFAEGLIERNGEGILGFVTSNGYLENPTFRGMRWRLAKTFDRIFVLDLHGSTGKREKTPTGKPDKNVFNIKQGVSIILAMKTGKKIPDELAEVFVADLYGTRREKFEALNHDEISWERIKLNPATFRFKKPHQGDTALYEAGLSISEIFNVKNVGFVTGRDHFVVSRTKDELWDRMERFVSMDVETAREAFSLRQDVTEWKVEWAQNDVRASFSPNNIVRVAYRPLDYRWAYFTETSKGIQCRPRNDVTKHFIGHENVGFAFARSEKDGKYSAVLAVNAPMEAKGSEASTQSYMAPLYLYREDGRRDSNLLPSAVKALSKDLSQEPEPEDIFNYCYGVLHDPTYRDTFAELLVSDFPRVMIPTSDDEFADFKDFGSTLRKLHLFEGGIGSPDFTFSVSGTDTVTFNEWRNECIFINEDQYFGNVEEEVWRFRLGGYEPAQKWLRDRKGTKLSDTEIDHYQVLLAIIRQTRQLIEDRRSEN